MTGFSQPERRGLERLQIAKPESHPDADLLSAFAEHSLTAREQEQVLGHLAVCGTCREVLAVAGSPLVEPVPEPARRRGMWEMPLFHWGAVAATVIVVVAAVSLGVRDRRSSPTQKTLSEMPSQAAEHDKLTAEPQSRAQEEATASTLDGRLGAPSAAASSAPRRAVHLQEQVRYESPTRPTANAKDKEAKQDANAFVVGGLVRPQVPGSNVTVTDGSSAVTTANATRGSALTADTVENVPASGRVFAEVQPAVPPSPAKARTKAADEYAANAGSTTQSVTVNAQNEVARSNAAPAPQPSSAPQSQQLMLLKKAETARAKSLPPAAFHFVSPIKSVATGTEWQITQTGTLQRSFNWGGRWENMLSDHNFRSVAVVNDHVWVGGDNGLLFSTSDNGRNWTPILVHDGNIALTGSIVRLRFIDVQHGSLDTSTGETWNSGDGGISWHKQ